jgi:hypothetical protein
VGAREFRREAEKLRPLTLKLIQILAASGQIEVSTWNPETGEPSSWLVGIKGEILYDVEAPPSDGGECCACSLASEARVEGRYRRERLMWPP